ncbi:MAG: YwiC-like family protein [Pasteurellaceae bacterium]|nr:YwiC-like family protein [Pasteurellaceae bacterium]
MKLLLSNQHGAIVMALMPFLYGMLHAQPIIWHLFLGLAWFSLYLMTYPFLSLFKGRNLDLYRRWSIIYAATSLLFALPALYYNWQVIWFVLAIFPLSFVSIYYTKQKNERALINDLVAILIFAIAGMAAYYFPQRQLDQGLWQTALYPSLFFIGTTLYVKSVLRERKNPFYLRLSLIFHWICCLIFIPFNLGLASAFIVPLLRAYYVPKQKLSTKQIGLLEMGVSLLFFIMLVLTT